jgi:hypothetical protein
MGRIRLDEPPLVGQDRPDQNCAGARQEAFLLVLIAQYEGPIVARTKVLDTRSGQGDICARIRAKRWGIASTPRFGLGVLVLERQGE